MKFQYAALILAIGLATGTVLAERVTYQSSARIPNIQRTDAQEAEAMRQVTRITLEQAKAIALKAVPGGTIKDAELDNEDGNVVYEVEVIDQKGIEHDLVIDAGNGKVLVNEVDLD
jgi:uncharacterized membrane protein YkoI